MEATLRVSSSGSTNREQLLSALSLFVLRILADDPDNALALDDFAFIADRLYRSSNFHCLLLSS